MKKTIITLMLAIASMGAVAATEKADTIKVDYSKISSVIEDKTVNSKGKATLKYYFLYNKELIPTSKNVVDKFKLCAKYHAICALAIVKKGKSKRIILD